MDDGQIHELLSKRIAELELRLTQACQRVNRERDSVAVIAITKTVSIRVAKICFELGLRHFGENRPQELWKKAEALPGAIWHFTGHLQRNKLDRTLPLIEWIHTVDSERLAMAISDFGVKRGSPVRGLLEFNCSREVSKSGFDPADWEILADKLLALPGIHIDGLMTMAAQSENPESARSTFAELRTLRERIAAFTGKELPHLSMGMTGDFEIAIEEGATFVRLGTVLFDGLDGE